VLPQPVRKVSMATENDGPDEKSYQVAQASEKKAERAHSERSGKAQSKQKSFRSILSMADHFKEEENR